MIYKYTNGKLWKTERIPTRPAVICQGKNEKLFDYQGTICLKKAILNQTSNIMVITGNH